MKHKIVNVIAKAQERLLGYIGQMSYEYAQLCIKADPSSLLGFEEVINGKTMRMEDLARVVVHDAEDDNDKIDIYPNDPSFIACIMGGMMSIHPEMQFTLEKYEEAEEDDDNPELKYLRLTMPKVNDDRRKLLLAAIDAIDEQCKVNHEKMKVKYAAELTTATLTEKASDADEAKKLFEQLFDNYKRMRERMTEEQKENVKKAFLRYAKEKAKEEGINRDEKGNPIGSTLKLED
ncbi:MAG: hypothetical protein ACI3Y0_12795 [Prevotella sp.]